MFGTIMVMNAVRGYVEAIANDDVRATIRWLDAADYRLSHSLGGPAESFGNALLVFTGPREVEITRDRGQWMIGISLAPGGERLGLDVLATARMGTAWTPPTHRGSIGASLPDQLPDGLSWSAALPDVLRWLDEPGAVDEAKAASSTVRDLMRRWWRDIGQRRS